MVRPDKPRRHCERSGALVARGWLASVRSSSAPSKTAESDDINRQDSCEFSSFETLLQGATGQFDIPPRPPATSAICAILPFPARVGTSASGPNRRVQSAFRERSVLAPLSHSVYDRFFWPGGTSGADLSGSRGETGNHNHAGKIVVMTLAARPRNHEKAVKSMTWRHFSLPSTLQRSARRTANLSKECRRGHLFFAQPQQIACLLGDA